MLYDGRNPTKQSENANRKRKHEESLRARYEKYYNEDTEYNDKVIWGWKRLLLCQRRRCRRGGRVNKDMGPWNNACPIWNRSLGLHPLVTLLIIYRCQTSPLPSAIYYLTIVNYRMHTTMQIIAPLQFQLRSATIPTYPQTNDESRHIHQTTMPFSMKYHKPRVSNVSLLLHFACIYNIQRCSWSVYIWTYVNRPKIA